MLKKMIFKGMVFEDEKNVLENMLENVYKGKYFIEYTKIGNRAYVVELTMPNVKDMLNDEQKIAARLIYKGFGFEMGEA